MSTALIGHTGFVGSNLARQFAFSDCYHSKNIKDIQGREFELIVCAGISAMKWWANLHPEEDLASINSLLECLGQVKARRFVLISSIDVYPKPIDVDERTCLDNLANHPYGAHRYLAETWVRSRFPTHHIVRLPGLFGPGLKKNVIFDLLHNNGLEKINPASSFQYYCLDLLWSDLERIMQSSLPLINLSSEPIITAEIVKQHFPGAELGSDPAPQAHYDMRSVHERLWQGRNGYLYSRDAVMALLSAFIEKERQSIK